MKTLLKITLFLICANSFAETYDHTGTINRFGTILIRDESDYITINGFTSAGNCPLSNGLVVARFPYGDSGSRAFSIALAARMSGKKVRLAVDDTNKHPVDGGCFVKSLEIKE